MVKSNTKRTKTLKKSRTFKYMLVYYYLKLKNQDPKYPQGMSVREISNGIRDTYNLSSRQLLKKQVTAALRRGIDYGIVKKINNKYSFDADSKAVSVWKQECSRAKKKTNKTTTPKRQPVPRPRVPKPPSFKPGKRNLREEPMPRIRKHSQPDSPDDSNDHPTNRLD